MEFEYLSNHSFVFASLTNFIEGPGCSMS